MDPENIKKKSDKTENDSENNISKVNSDENSGNENNSEMQEPGKKIKPDWDDREIDFDQLIF